MLLHVPSQHLISHRSEMSVCWHCENLQSDMENKSSPFSQMTALPWRQEHAHSTHVHGNHRIFGFTLNLFILIIQHAVAFRAAVRSATWFIAVLNPSEHTGPAHYKCLLGVQKLPVQNSRSVNCCLEELVPCGRCLKGAWPETPRGTL